MFIRNNGYLGGLSVYYLAFFILQVEVQNNAETKLPTSQMVSRYCH